ncbi:MAG: hypothetical protein ACJAVK_001151 [Akkermansiaceae bacterium]
MWVKRSLQVGVIAINEGYESADSAGVLDRKSAFALKHLDDFICAREGFEFLNEDSGFLRVRSLRHLMHELIDLPSFLFADVCERRILDIFIKLEKGRLL